MKKLFAVLAIAGSLVACDNAASDQEKRTKDSTDSVRREDSIRNANPVPTPTPTPDTTGTTTTGGDTTGTTTTGGDTTNR